MPAMRLQFLREKLNLATEDDDIFVHNLNNDLPVMVFRWFFRRAPSPPPPAAPEAPEEPPAEDRDRGRRSRSRSPIRRPQRGNKKNNKFDILPQFFCKSK